ncbi:hypothetical protein L484_005960 [Morus notabilis]|uniref:F-box associated domain-containing protein n=1 Tax=Morus notabilis TaxID=981085 RepID=W9RV23_9ROSA|nr:hypothetical protein L484_005960 [Morus notabilis]
MVRTSCDGLLCCSSIPDKDVYYVFNPMTGDYKILPRSRVRPVTQFHPDSEAALMGLACNLSTQKFNVVLAPHHRAFGHTPDGIFMFLVFDSESKWKKNQVVFVNRALHWLTGSSSSCVVALDLDADVWRRMLLPDGVNEGSGNRAYLLELDGCLSVIQISDTWMNTWVLKSCEKEEWSLVDRVSLRCVRGLLPGIIPICQNGEFVFLATQKHVLLYHRKTLKAYGVLHLAQSTSNDASYSFIVLSFIWKLHFSLVYICRQVPCE